MDANSGKISSLSSTVSKHCCIVHFPVRLAPIKPSFAVATYPHCKIVVCYKIYSLQIVHAQCSQDPPDLQQVFDGKHSTCIEKCLVVLMHVYVTEGSVKEAGTTRHWFRENISHFLS